VPAARLDVAWLLVLGVQARRSGTSQVEIVGLSWASPLETVPIDRSSFWLVILGVRARRSGTSQVETVWLSWTTPLETVPIDRSPFWLVILVNHQAYQDFVDRVKPTALTYPIDALWTSVTCVSIRRFLVSQSLTSRRSNLVPRRLPRRCFTDDSGCFDCSLC